MWSIFVVVFSFLVEFCLVSEHGQNVLASFIRGVIFHSTEEGVQRKELRAFSVFWVEWGTGKRNDDSVKYL